MASLSDGLYQKCRVYQGCRKSVPQTRLGLIDGAAIEFRCTSCEKTWLHELTRDERIEHGKAGPK